MQCLQQSTHITTCIHVQVSNLVFYTQSTTAVISGRNTFCFHMVTVKNARYQEQKRQDSKKKKKKKKKVCAGSIKNITPHVRLKIHFCSCGHMTTWSKVTKQMSCHATHLCTDWLKGDCGQTLNGRQQWQSNHCVGTIITTLLKLEQKNKSCNLWKDHHSWER